MLWPIIFVIGFLVGVIAQRSPFGVFGPLADLVLRGSARRTVGVVAAMCVFALVNVRGYRHGLEYPGALFLVGGVIQGAGYYLASGCPLGLLGRLGEGSKFHLIVFVAFAAGAALYASFLAGPLTSLLGSISTERFVTWLDLFR